MYVFGSLVCFLYEIDIFTYTKFQENNELVVNISGFYNIK